MGGACWHIGTSGWSYDHWVGPFYPADLPAEGRLAHYARRLASVEINGSFYGQPSPETLEGWQQVVPEDFVFAAKASRYITHMKKFKDPEPGVSRFLERMQRLGDRLGPILFQLPPRWRANPARLEAFLAALDGGLRSASTSSTASARPSASRPTSSASACTDRAAPTGATTTRRRSQPGRNASATGATRVAMSTSTFDNDESGFAVRNALTVQALVRARIGTG
ncbi:hypothetical protein Thimo_0159 [Thioflavicoccus mobilis 8321]|uniref:DUF72 domain-containing protein n=1 Tax=Thioflavicoccus mobilis 8321 TaxID=765912 RepID=L0GUR2_9GAMM|nr:DUF72 domain-containing protein [Thioflavicoccus mobilis]AGA89034.1 hypothetical protein Thimo_0159 [Thioflavicoccus mobilis 8321]